MRLPWILISSLSAAACQNYSLQKADLLKPESCIDCHPTHVQEWSGSMHAYAAQDPVFRAMNAKGQRETNGALGTFCVDCHAPMAVREGLTDDGLNLDDLPSEYQGVTCYFCHSIDGVTGNHNAAVSLASDLVMRGGLPNPTPNTAHRSAYSSLMDRNQIESADACGACHDVVTPSGVHLERSYLEWQNSLYAEDVRGLRQTCGNCHMDGRDGVAADYPGVPSRRVHSHAMPGVDVALTPFPYANEQRELVQRSLNTTVGTTLDVCATDTGFAITLMLENVSAGHSWPSGAAHDRRAWVEVIASREGNPVFESGVVEANQELFSLNDPNLLNFGDRLFNDDDEEVFHFWEATRYDSNLLSSIATLYTADFQVVDGHYYHTWTVEGAMPDSVSVNVFLRPIGLDILNDLVASGDLEQRHVDAMPTFNLQGAAVVWTSETPSECDVES